MRSFVVSQKIDTNKFPEANFIKVDDSLQALQTLAIEHRKRFTIPVIGITGSNGKTIVKEWLYQLLHQDYNIVKSPKSFNSQIGVPLSVWQMHEQHTLAIFEAGISKPGEMDTLEKIIQPTIGVLTNIGEAHSEGFNSTTQKEKEKRLLFRNAAIPELVVVNNVNKEQTSTTIAAIYKALGIAISIPFNDDASIQNAITCWQVLLHLGYENKVIAERMKLLTPVNMRLELKKGINHCSIVNDSYSADISSLEIALNFLDQQSTGENKIVILSDFLQSSMPDKLLYAQIFKSLQNHGIIRLVGIGKNISAFFQAGNMNADIQIQLFPSTADFLDQFLSSQFKEEVILIKGARVFAFEQIVQLLEQKAHQTALEINLNAIVHNLKEYQQCLKPETKIMAMVKAFAYGSGGAEIAGILQYHNVDYLGVAYADEGVELRKAGIILPIMVMNPEEYAFETIVEHNLQPELYSFELLHSFNNFLQQEGIRHYPVHLEIETGMNRLGFSVDDIENLSEILNEASSLKVQTVFTHFA
ncbi:MAG: alanine racemase, partial [Chitinophagaceae bacterium]